MKIEQHIIDKAWENFLEFHYGLHCEELEARFFDYLDPKDASQDVINFGGSWDDDVPIDVIPEAAEKLKMLAGPHWRTVITAAYICGSISKSDRRG